MNLNGFDFTQMSINVTRSEGCKGEMRVYKRCEGELLKLIFTCGVFVL